MQLFPVVLIIGSQIWRSSCSYLIVLKSSVTRRKAVNTDWRTIEEDGKQIQEARSPGAVFSICWATDSQLIMQVVINIKAGDNMGKACTSRATGDHSAAIHCFSFMHTAFHRNTILPVFFPLKVKKIDLTLSLNFAKSREEHRENKSLQACEANLLCYCFIVATNLVEILSILSTVL